MNIVDPTNGKAVLPESPPPFSGPLPPIPNPSWDEQVLERQLRRAVNEFHYTSVAYSRACLEGLVKQLPEMLASLTPPRNGGASRSRIGPSESELRSILEGTDHRPSNQPWSHKRDLAALSSQERDALESYWWSEFGGSDEFYQLRLQSGALPIPLATPSDRRGGTLWPIWRTEQELNRLRQESRIVSTKNCYGQGLLLNKTNYVIHTGYNYGCRGKDRKQLMAVPARYRYERDAQGVILTDAKEEPQFVSEERLNRYAEMTRGVVDDFVARNHFNTSSVDPLSDNEQVMPREKESYIRVQQDGDAVLRFFFHGKPKVRIPGKRSLLEPAPSSKEAKDLNSEIDSGGAIDYASTSYSGSVTVVGSGSIHSSSSNGSVVRNPNAVDKERGSLGEDARGPILMDLEDLARLDSSHPTEEVEDDLQGKCSVRFVEPECIVNPPGGTWSKGWAIGKHFKSQPAQDLEILLEIYVKYQDESLESEQQKEHPGGYYVPGWQVVWIKPHMELASTARGLPWFSLDRAAALRRAAYIQQFSSQTAAEQARTSEIWRHLTDTKTNIQQMAAGIAALGGVGGASQAASLYGSNQAFSQSGDPSWIKHGGMNRRIGTGQEAVNTSELYGNPFEQHLKVAMGDLTQVGAASGAPASMVSGDATGSSYANAVQAGNPFVRGGEAEQSHFKVAFLRCAWKAVRWAVECDILPIEVLYLVEITAEPSIVTQGNKMEMAQVASLNIQNSTTSRQIEARKIGNDPDRVFQDNEEYNERFGQPGGAMGLPGQPQLMPGAPGGEQPQEEPPPDENGLAELFQPPDQGGQQGGAPGQVGSSQTGAPVQEARGILENLATGFWLDLPDDLL